MSVTKEQWIAIESYLSGPLSTVGLRCDGYTVTAQVRLLSPLKYGILIFVNGECKAGEWMKGDTEEARKFLFESKRYLYSAEDRKRATKALKQRRLDPVLRKLYEGTLKQLSSWYPYWTSPKAFCRHLRKTCTEIEVIRMGYEA